MKKCYQAIAAISENYAISYKNKIPWCLPEDMQWVKKITTGQIIVMGRKTFESIGKPLPNRENIVLTKSSNFLKIKGITALSNIEQISQIKTKKRIIIFGGSDIYNIFIPYCKELFITHVKRKVKGDKFFPIFKHMFKINSIIKENDAMKIIHYCAK